MSAYIDLDYYQNTFKGKGNDQQIESAIVKACLQVDVITNYSLKNGQYKFDGLHVSIKDRVKEAVALLTEHYIINGGYDAVMQTNLSSVKIGDFNYSKAKVKEVPDNVVNILNSTGLMYAGIGGVSECYYNPYL